MSEWGRQVEERDRSKANSEVQMFDTHELAVFACYARQFVYDAIGLRAQGLKAKAKAKVKLNLIFIHSFIYLFIYAFVDISLMPLMKRILSLFAV